MKKEAIFLVKNLHLNLLSRREPGKVGGHRSRADRQAFVLEEVSG